MQSMKPISSKCIKETSQLMSSKHNNGFPSLLPTHSALTTDHHYLAQKNYLAQKCFLAEKNYLAETPTFVLIQTSLSVKST